VVRTKEFDPDEALGKAMLVFWEQGFEHTSMQDLVTHMGVHKRSMYDTFGDKQELFIKALTRYCDKAEKSLRLAIENATSARKTLRALVEKSIVDGSVHSRGCLLVNSATELAARDEQAAELVERHLAGSQRLLAELIVKGQRAGEIDDRRDAVRLSRLVFNVWLGMRVQVKAGATRKQLDQMAGDMLALLD
jgi:TetR/AcrR family transcriptional repressor of nem operon